MQNELTNDVDSTYIQEEVLRMSINLLYVEGTSEKLGAYTKIS